MLAWKTVVAPADNASRAKVSFHFDLRRSDGANWSRRRIVRTRRIPMIEVIFSQFCMHVGDVLGPQAAGDETGLAFENAKPHEVVVHEPQPMLSRHVTGNLLQKSPPLL